MGKKRSRPSVIVPYHVYHFKDMRREYDFVCLEDIRRESLRGFFCGRLYKVMMFNHRKVTFPITFPITNEVKNEDYQCGTIQLWVLEVVNVSFIEKSDYTKNAIRLAKLLTL